VPGEGFVIAKSISGFKTFNRAQNQGRQQI
jgi:hypothetical protein